MTRVFAEGYKEGSNRHRPTAAKYEGETVWEFIERCFKEGKYRYEDGNVYRMYDFRGKGSWLDEKVKIGKLNSRGYLSAGIRFNGRAYSVFIHRMIYVVFHGSEMLKDGLVINHINGVKTDNRIENLELVTSKENVHHAWRTGLSTIENSGPAKLTWEKVAEIRELYNSKQLNQVELASIYGVDQTTISEVVRNKTWRDGHGENACGERLEKPGTM